MTIKPLLLVSSLTLAATSIASAESATFTWLLGGNSANDLTPDGRIVVGSHNSLGGYSWTQEDGYTYLGGESAVAVSDDGSVIFGQIDDPMNPGYYVAAIWKQDTGWRRLGGLPGGGLCPSVSSAYELSADGKIAVGLAWVDGCNGSAFRWTRDGGMVGMELLANGSNRASVVSADGALLGGFAQGSFSRTPAIWHADGTGELLDPPNGDVLGEVQGMSDDGSILLGSWDGSAFYRTEDEGVVTFPTIIASWTGIALDIGDDGTIVGFDILMTSRIAWIKRPGQPAQKLTDYLQDIGVVDVPSSLEVPQAISPDGRVIIGHNAFSNGWIIHLPTTGDIDRDGIVGFSDLLIVLSEWGPCGDPCPADLDGDGLVGFADLLIVLSNWS